MVRALAGLERGRAERGLSWLGILLGVCAAAVLVTAVILRWVAPQSSLNETSPSGPAPISQNINRPPDAPDRPQIEITADHQLKRVRHKDAEGNAPLELVNTPAGTITIQRTFKTDGTLLKEEAFLNGSPVPVPIP